MIANLRFGPDATIDRHSAPYDIDVICMSGAGYTSIGEDVSLIRAGQTVRWPRDREHCLWTEDSPMETIMAERYEADPREA
ncbi:MAG: cupin domain-containing protein [Planctomycetota bacterium]